MSPSKEERVLRASVGAVAGVGVAALIFVVGFVSIYRNEGWSWKSVGLGVFVFSILGCVGRLGDRGDAPGVGSGRGPRGP